MAEGVTFLNPRQEVENMIELTEKEITSLEARLKRLQVRHKELCKPIMDDIAQVLHDRICPPTCTRRLVLRPLGDPIPNCDTLAGTLVQALGGDFDKALEIAKVADIFKPK